MTFSVPVLNSVPTLDFEILRKDAQVRFSTNLTSYKTQEPTSPKTPETPDTPDTPKTPKSPISPIRLPEEPIQTRKKKRIKILRSSSISSRDNNKSGRHSKRNSELIIHRRLSSSQERKHYLEAPIEEALDWVCSIIYSVNAKDLNDPKTQDVAHQIIEKSSHGLLEECFFKFQTVEQRICFLKLLKDEVKHKFANLCTYEEIDELIDSIEDYNKLPQTEPKKVHFEKYNQIINSLSENRKAEYFKILNNPNDINFIKAVKSCSPSKLNVALSNVWLKNIPALQKAISISKMLDCPEGTEKGNIGTNVPSRDIAWRCDQLSSTHLAAIFPILSTQTVKDLRRLDKIKYINEQLAYSEMDYETFVTIINEGKLHPKFSDDPEFLVKILKLKNKSNKSKELDAIKRRLTRIELLFSDMLFEKKQKDREAHSLLSPSSQTEIPHLLQVTNHLPTE